jgi:molybdate transport system substrate-binding protein
LTVPTKIKVMSAGAVEAMVRKLGSEFERTSGYKLDIVINTAGALRDRLTNGEAADLVILPPAALDALGAGMFVPGSRIDLGRTVTGVAVREGAPVPDISTPEGFKQALLKARSVGYTDPKAGGSSGTFFAGLLDRLGIAEAVNKKAFLGNRGVEVARAVADGRAEIGTTFISEILTVQGAKLVGPLPAELHKVNTYTGAILAVSAARDAAMALLRTLTLPATAARWKAAGLEPAFLK